LIIGDGGDNLLQRGEAVAADDVVDVGQPTSGV
jgi:hypothetical protein